MSINRQYLCVHGVISDVDVPPSTFSFSCCAVLSTILCVTCEKNALPLVMIAELFLTALRHPRLSLSLKSEVDISTIL